MVASTDVTPPGAVLDLTKDLCAQTAVNLMWTPSGDDGMTGTATYTDLRYSTSPITADNFCLATPVYPQPVPGTPGTTQQFLVTGLPPCSSLHFSIKFLDEAGNASPFSGSVAANTLCECCMGDASAHLARENGAVARPGEGLEGLTAASAAGWSPQPTGATVAVVGRGLVVESRPGSGGLDLKVFPIESAFEGRAVASNGGVVLHRPDHEGHWAGWIDYALPESDRFALCAPEQPTRWVFLAPSAVTGVLPAVRGEAAGWRLESARHSRLGDVTAALSLADSLPGLGEGDTLVAHYAAAPDTGAPAGGWMLLLGRAGAEAPAARAGRRPAAEGTALPAAFALHQSQPNPFAERVAIRFALAVASYVRLEVFDLLGRRVRTLADTRYDAGEHEVAWDRRTARGVRAAPGLYFYRMEAGAFRARRAMMIVP
jgi:hypothetical protein